MPMMVVSAVLAPHDGEVCGVTCERAANEMTKILAQAGKIGIMFLLPNTELGNEPHSVAMWNFGVILKKISCSPTSSSRFHGSEVM